MMHLALKRLEAPGSLEVRCGWGWEHPHGDGVGWGGDVERGAIRRWMRVGVGSRDILVETGGREEVQDGEQ